MMKTLLKTAAGLYTDGRILCALIVAAALAFSPLDQIFTDWYTAYVKSGFTDDLADVFKLFGEHKMLVPAYFVLFLIARQFRNDTLRRWSCTVLVAFLLGVAGLLLGQIAVGASRPWEGIGSAWHPFQDDNGVSGHAWVGAIPFLAAAFMVRNAGLKTALIVLSMLCGWSRLNDEAHYLSQVLLGWSWAYLSVRHAHDAPFTGGYPPERSETGDAQMSDIGQNPGAND